MALEIPLWAAKEMEAAKQHGEDLGLTDDEIAFYDALSVDESAVQLMGADKLKVIAAELISTVRKSVTIDWTLRESARAKIKVMVKRILNSMAIHPIYKLRRLRQSYNRLNCCVRTGLQEKLNETRHGASSEDPTCD